MLIGLDLLHARPRIGGAWNYIAGIMDVLKQQGGDNTYVAYCTHLSEPLIPTQENFLKKRFNLDAENPGKRTTAECGALQWAAKRDGIEVLHVFSGVLAPLRACPNVVTFYDFVSEASPTSVGGAARRAYFRLMSSFVIRQAEVVAPISATIAGEMNRRYPASARRTVVVPFPVGEHFRRTDEADRAAFRAHYGLPERFWLYVAHYYPHKNHQRLFEAYAQWRRHHVEPWPLVLRGNKHGAEAALDEMLAAAGIGEHVIWLPSLDDTEMAHLYSSATALLYPSLYEGAGLPLVEAMACGCPIAASDIPTSREFCGQAAVLFDPTKIEPIVAAMVRLSSDAALRTELTQLGLQEAEQYRPERVALALTEAYARAAGRSG